MTGVMMAQAGTAGAAVGGETVTLHGTLGTPITAIHLALQPSAAEVTWLFAGSNSTLNSIVRGQAQRATYDSGDLATFVSVNITTDWVIPNDFQEGQYYIRAQLQSGDDQPIAGTNTPLSVIGTADNPADWATLSNGGSNVSWRWEGTGPIPQAGTIKVQISTSTSEAGILSTGYYRAVASSEF